MIKPYGQPSADPEMICNRVKTLKLTTFRALPIAGMQCRDLIVLARDGSCNATIHSAAYQDYGLRFVGIRFHFLSNGVGDLQELGF
jgi:hypothetical protein